MRIKQVTRILAIVGFITLSLANAKMGGIVKQRLAERVQTPENLALENILMAEDPVVPHPTILAQVQDDGPVEAERPIPPPRCGCHADCHVDKIELEHCDLDCTKIKSNTLEFE